MRKKKEPVRQAGQGMPTVKGRCSTSERKTSTFSARCSSVWKQEKPRILNMMALLSRERRITSLLPMQRSSSSGMTVDMPGMTAELPHAPKLCDDVEEQVENDELELEDTTKELPLSSANSVRLVLGEH